MNTCIASGSLAFIEWCSEALRLRPVANGQGLRPVDVAGTHIYHASTEPLRPDLAAAAARTTAIHLELAPGTDLAALSVEQVRTAARTWIQEQQADRDAIDAADVRAALDRMRQFQQLPSAQRTNPQRLGLVDDHNTVLLALIQRLRAGG